MGSYKFDGNGPLKYILLFVFRFLLVDLKHIFCFFFYLDFAYGNRWRVWGYVLYAVQGVLHNRRGALSHGCAISCQVCRECGVHVLRRRYPTRSNDSTSCPSAS